MVVHAETFSNRNVYTRTVASVCRYRQPIQSISDRLLASDFKEFLKSLNSNSVEYLLIGGYAVGIYGHIGATNDLHIWVNVSPENAARIDHALRQFGFAAQSLTPDLFLVRNNVVRMGVPPIRI